MKKLLSVIVSVLAICCIAATLVACGTTHTHTLQKVESTPSTCTAEGRMQHWKCTECDALFSDEDGQTEITLSQTVVSKVAHKDNDSDCKCDACGRQFDHVDSDNNCICDVCNTQLAHKEVTVDAVYATCVKTGLTEGKKCSVCGTVTVEQQITEKIPHKDATGDCKCDICKTAVHKDENKDCVCDVCKLTFHTIKTLPAVPATCTKTGLSEGKKCSVCGTVLAAQQTVATIPHNYVNGVCSMCDKEISVSDKLEFAPVYDEDGTTVVAYSVVGIGTETERAFAIPGTHEGLPVTSIGEGAFGNGTLTSVIIPESVTSIGKSAFSYCASLMSITIPENVTSIKEEAFYNCKALTIYCEVAARPSGWPSLWNKSICPVVWDCHNNDVATDGKIYVIAEGIRYSLKDGVASVEIQPQDAASASILSSVAYKGANYAVTSIAERAYSGCGSLVSVTIPKSVTKIGSQSFRYCVSLTVITIPDSVTDIGHEIFVRCNSLTIYCEAASKQRGWDIDWNYSECPVVWGCAD